MTRSTSPAGAPTATAKYRTFCSTVRSSYTDACWEAYPTSRRSSGAPAGRPRTRTGPAARPAQARARAAGDPLGADDGPHERGLAAAARPEEPGDRPGRDLDIDSVEHRVPTAHDREPGTTDCGVGHGH